jgi:hypothetical protein
MRSMIFLIQHPKMPSSRVRVLNLLPYLKGLEFKVAPYPRPVFLQKKMPTVF